MSASSGKASLTITDGALSCTFQIKQDVGKPAEYCYVGTVSSYVCQNVLGVDRLRKYVVEFKVKFL
jgi:hypothetical protein